MELMKHQERAIQHLDNGKILYGVVGSGKSAVALAYYMKNESPKELFVITTAKKRDGADWEGEAAKFGIGKDPDATLGGILHVDSWQNIQNYVGIEDSFFIFDEQRLVGNGAWVKAFQKIAKKNNWIILSGTPGDTWMDYAPVFIANGYYKNITRFKMEHVLYEPFTKYPKIRGYLKVEKLERLRNEVLVEMPYIKHTERVLNYLDVGYDVDVFNKVLKERWHVFEDRPIRDISEMFRVMRKVVNTDPSRLEMIHKLQMCHLRMIIFYNFNYELEILRTINGGLNVYEWNGHRKDPLPAGDKWVYLVQYVAGAEGWNCTTTDAMVMYSMTYSYKNFEQAQGRIDRLDTKFDILYYYIFTSNSVIDRAIKKALGSKKTFNERKFMSELEDLEVNLGNFDEEHREGCQI